MLGGALTTTPLHILDDNPNIPQYDGNVTIVSLSDTESECDQNLSYKYYSDHSDQQIPVIILPRLPVVSQPPRTSANIIIRHNNKKVITASQLPVVINLNPRSIYN